MTNTYKIVSQLDPYTTEYVNKLACEGYNQGELNISMPNSDTIILGWWHLGEDNELTFCVNDIDELQHAYDKFDKG